METFPIPCEMDPNPKYYIYAMYILGCISTPVGLFASYCVLIKTPEQLKDYRRSLLFYQITVSLSDFCLALFYTPVEFHPLPLVYSAGIGSLLGLNPSIIFAVCLTFLIQSMCGVLQLLYYRLIVILPANNILKIRPCTLKICRILSVIIFTLPLILVLKFYPKSSNTPEYLAELSQKYTCFDALLNYPQMQIVEYQIYRIMYIYTGLFGIVLMSFAIGIGFRTYYIMRNLPVISEKAHKMQHKFQLILIVQMTTPLLIVAIPGWFYIIHVVIGSIVPQGISAIFLLCLSINGLVGNIIMLSLNDGYRKFTYSCLLYIINCSFRKRRQVQVEPETES